MRSERDGLEVFIFCIKAQVYASYSSSSAQALWLCPPALYRENGHQGVLREILASCFFPRTLPYIVPDGCPHQPMRLVCTYDSRITRFDSQSVQLPFRTERHRPSAPKEWESQPSCPIQNQFDHLLAKPKDTNETHVHRTSSQRLSGARQSAASSRKGPGRK